MNLLDELDELENLDDTSRDQKIVKAPFGWPGGKTKSIKHILPLLPYTGRWVDVFAGAGTITFARRPCKLEVFNDRYSGITDFYRVIRDPEKLDLLCQRLDATIHSREEFFWCRESWENVNDSVERAARWYYMVITSFASLGRHWGRSTGSTRMAGKLKNKLPDFPFLHERLKHIQFENQDWEQCMSDYDYPDTVFYLDPPYVDASKGTYKHEMTHDDHHRMIDKIFSCEGFVALSGFPNPLFDNQPWDDKYEWEIKTSLLAINALDNDQNFDAIRGCNKECLWIKEAS